MKRKDMKPGVLHAVKRTGVYRPGLILSATTERIRARVYWTWPGDSQEGIDYLDPHPDILSPLAKYDDVIVKTSDVAGVWESWATRAKADKAQRLADLLAKEAQEEADKAAELESRLERLARVDHLLANATGYLDIRHLESDAARSWTHNRYSAKDVLELLESIVEGQS